MRRLRDTKLGPKGGMALAEVLKSNTTLETLESAALPSNPLAHTFSPHSTHVLCTCSFSPCLCRVRRLCDNELGPEGGMALAEALKSNTTLKELKSAALPSNPLAHTFKPHSTYVLCTCSFSPCLCGVRRLRDNELGPEGGMALAEALKSNTTLKELESAALPSNPLAPAQLPCISPHSSFLRCLSSPARSLIATSHSLLVPRISPAHAQPINGLHTQEHAAATHVAAHHVDRGHALLCPKGGLVARRPCTLTLAPARRRLRGNNLGDEAEEWDSDDEDSAGSDNDSDGSDEQAVSALRAAAGSGLRVVLFDYDISDTEHEVVDIAFDR